MPVWVRQRAQPVRALSALAAEAICVYSVGMRSFLLAALLSVPAAADDVQPARLRYEPRCILEAVARDISHNIGRHRGPAVEAALLGAARVASVPRVRLQSETPLVEFLAAVAPQAPGVDRFSNFYIVAANEIFLLDDAAFYAKFGRSVDDSLAHEYVHYLQVLYLGYSLADLDADSTEYMAVEYQTRFRDRYIKGGETPPCPPKDQ